jgi:hypothetical protein
MPLCVLRRAAQERSGHDPQRRLTVSPCGAARPAYDANVAGLTAASRAKHAACRWSRRPASTRSSAPATDARAAGFRMPHAVRPAGSPWISERSSAPKCTASSAPLSCWERFGRLGPARTRWAEVQDRRAVEVQDRPPDGRCAMSVNQSSCAKPVTAATIKSWPGRYEQRHRR